MMTLAMADMSAASTLFQGGRKRLLLLSFPTQSETFCPLLLYNRRVVDYFYNHRSTHRTVCVFSPFSPSPSADGEGDGYCYDYEKQKQEATEAVSDILQENGVSEKESMEIAMKSPKYVEMLMDSVHDLDQLFQSTSSGSSAVNSSYKKKVMEMGLRKGDKGLVPLLESMVGLPLPSAIHIARYLSHHPSSPNLLLYKIKYIKEILFFDVIGETQIATSARRMMMHLSVHVDEDVQQTLSFLEKIQARRGGLDLLGSGDRSFRYLIESFPRLLLLSVESNIKPMVDFLEYMRVPKDCIRNILLLFPSLLFYDIEKEIKPRMLVFTKV